MEKIFKVKLKGRKEIAEDTTAFYFEKPEEFKFRAGQHIEIALIDPPETDAKGNRRIFSLASSPSENDLMVVTRMRSTAFKKVLKNMEIGNTVNIEGPYGSFILHSDSSKPAVFLIGGIGITPVLSIIKDALEIKLPHRIFLFYSNRRPEDAAFLQELKDLADKNHSFRFIPTMTDSEKSSERWGGEKGYIEFPMIERYVDDLHAAVYYLAGPSGMIVAMRKILAEANVNEDNIKTEEFSGY